MGWLPLLVLLPSLEPALVETEDGAGAGPERPEVVVSVELAVASTYVFRGELQYPTASVPSFQPGLTVEVGELGPGALEATVWSAVAMVDRPRINRQGSASELDLGIAYRAGLIGDWLLLGIGFAYYLYPEAERVDGEKEILVELGLGNLPVTPSVALWTEVHPGLGLHVEPRVAWEQRIGSYALGVDLSLGATVARGSEASLDHATLTLGLEQEVGSLAFGFSLSYTIQLSPSRGDFMDRSLVYGAVAMGYRPEPRGAPSAESYGE